MSQNDGYLYNGERDRVISLSAPEPNRLQKILSYIGIKSAQDRPDFGQGLTAYRPNWMFSGWDRWNESVDYSREAGNLGESSLVMAIVNDFGIAIAEPEPSVRKRTGDKWKTIEGHALSALIQFPNPFNTWQNYCKAISLSWWIDGNAYLKKVFDKTGTLIELWYIPHYLVEERWPDDGRSPEVPSSEADNDHLTHYQYNVPGKSPILIKRAEIVHLKNGVDLRNPRRGVGVFGSVLREIAGDNAVSNFAATLMRNFGIVPYLLAPKDTNDSLTPTQALHIKQQWVQRTTGAEIGQPLVNAIPLEVTKLGFDPEQLKLGELRTIFESRVAAVSRYPAAYLQYLVGLQNGTSYAAYKEAREQAFEQVVIPILMDFNGQLTRQLMYEFEKDKGFQFVFDTSDVRVLQEDRDAKYKRTADAFRAGITTLNEARSSLDKEGLGEDGDIYLVPSMSNPMTMEKLKAQAEDMSPPPVPQPIDPASLAKFADVDRTIQYLEEQLKSFDANAI